MPKPTHPDRYAQFIRKPNNDKLDNINCFDGYEDFNSDKKIKMYHLTYDKKTKKISYKIELVPKIDAVGKYMQGDHLYVDKEMNTKEENEILEKFLKKQSKNVKPKSSKIKNQFFKQEVINEINRTEEPALKLSIRQKRMKNYDNYINDMNKQKKERSINNRKKVKTVIPAVNQDDLRKYKIKSKNYGI